MNEHSGYEASSESPDTVNAASSTRSGSAGHRVNEVTSADRSGASDVVTEMSVLTTYAERLLQGERVRLRMLEDDDLPSLRSWWRTPALAVLQAGQLAPKPDSVLDEMFRGWSANSDTGSAGFSIVDSETDELVGHVSVWGSTPSVRTATFAILIAPDAQSRGYGSDAARVMLRYAFDELGVDKLELEVWEYNTRALRTYRSLGFVTEGVRRNAIRHDGALWGNVLMGLLRSEYDALRAGLSY